MRRWTLLAVTGLVAGRTLVGHLTLPLLLVVRGAPFLGLVVIRPNETTLAIGSAQASAGHLPWALLFLAALVGAVASDGLSYALGRTAGEAAVARLSHHRIQHRTGRLVERSRRLVERHGAVAVIAARPTIVAHGAVPVVAGIARMPATRFLAASSLGATIWAAAWLGGTAVVLDVVRAGGVTAAIIAAVVVALVLAVAVRECLRRPTCLGQPT